MSGKTSFLKKIESKFDQRVNPVPMNKRFGSYVVDWALGGIVCGLPAVFMYGGVTGRSDMFSNLYVFESLGFERYWGILAGILCIVFALAYYVYIPWKVFPGQTVGKKIAGLKIEKVDGGTPGLKELLMRQALAIFLIEGSVFVISGYIRQLATLVTRFYIDIYWQYAALFFTFISIVLALYTASHRALHDYIGGTKVVLAPTTSEKELKVEKVEPTPKPKKKEIEPSVETPSQPKHLPKKNKTKK